MLSGKLKSRKSTPVRAQTSLPEDLGRHCCRGTPAEVVQTGGYFKKSARSSCGFLLAVPVNIPRLQWHDRNAIVVLPKWTQNVISCSLLLRFDPALILGLAKHTSNALRIFSGLMVLYRRDLISCHLPRTWDSLLQRVLPFGKPAAYRVWLKAPSGQESRGRSLHLKHNPGGNTPGGIFFGD